MIYFCVPFGFSAHPALFRSMLTFIIQSPLPGVYYIGYFRSSRPSPGLPHSDVQIFPFPIPLPLALWAHFCTHGPISISWLLFGNCLPTKPGSWVLISSCTVFWAGPSPTCRPETFPRQLSPPQCCKPHPQWTPNPFRSASQNRWMRLEQQG